MTFFTHSIDGFVHRVRRKWLRTFYELPPLQLDEYFPPGTKIKDPILDDCCLPPYLGTKDHDDYRPLMRIVNSLKPTVVLELGTAFGNTVANICNGHSETRVFTVNALPENQSGSLVTCELNKEDIGRVYRAHGFTPRVTQIYENTLHLNLSLYFREPVIDLVIIDACHDTDFVINDFFKVKDFIRAGGVVLLHDTFPSVGTHLEGSYVACMQLRRRGYDVHHIPNTWWGIWRRENTNGH